MTSAARQVLDDCRVALHMLEDETNLQKWRVHWAAAVALIRAVGHVLDKVDGENRDIKIVSSKRFKLWKNNLNEHEIFREFIERERNTLLKEYEFNIHPLEDVGIVMTMKGQPIDGGELVEIGQDFKIGENIYRPLMDGPWAGDDARDVLQEAIDWWERELDLIDKLAC